MRERDLIVIPVTNVQVKFNVALPFFLEKHPHHILVVSDDCHQFPIFSSFWVLFSLFLGVLATKDNLFTYMYRLCPFFLGILVISHIKGNNDIFIVPLLPSCNFGFPHPWKNTFRDLSLPIVAQFHLGMQSSLLLPFSPQSSTIFFFLFFHSEAAVKTCPN